MSKKQDSFFFDHFIECAEYSCKSIELLETIVTDFNIDKVTEYTARMHELEHAGDLKKHEITSALVKTFITPIDREDIVSVSQNIDDLTDKIEDVLIRIYCNRVTQMRPDVIELVRVVHKCCDEVLAMLHEFSRFKKSKSLKEHIININTLEEEADKLYISCMYNLHDSSNDALQIIAWRDIYTYLENCADTTEHIADIVESVAMKNS